MPPTVICVDDEGDVTELLRFHLEREGISVFTAATGREALALIGRHPPDLLILDLMLPDIDGFGVCEILRSRSGTATIPVIILSAWATPDAHLLGLELGALDYVTKPFRIRDLVARVCSLLQMPPVSTP